jgi:hypothetical protein
MKKKIYEKPSMKVYQLQSKAQILAGSGEPDASLWDGEID